MNKKISIDIDNSLWDFAPVLWEYLKKANHLIPEPSTWNDWYFWREYVSDSILFQKVSDIQIRQEEFEPFSEAEQFLMTLKEAGNYIIIASHRSMDTFQTTENWLIKYSLVYDEIHLSHGKSVLFYDCYAIVDDSPQLLYEAARKGKIGCGLKKPWNDGMDYKLFTNLLEVSSYLDGEFESNGKKN